MVLVDWVLVLLLPLRPVVVPHDMTQVVLGTADVPQSLSSLSKACLMSLLAVLSIHLLTILCVVFLLQLVVPWSVSKV